MAAMGLPVPEAFVLGTAWCRRERALPRTAWQPALQALQDATGLALGDARRPLLAVRSGAPVSMPGMMDTVLNIGLCDASVRGLVRRTGNPRLAWTPIGAGGRLWRSGAGHRAGRLRGRPRGSGGWP